jgi:hypothetical protein
MRRRKQDHAQPIDAENMATQRVRGWMRVQIGMDQAELSLAFRVWRAMLQLSTNGRRGARCHCSLSCDKDRG